MSRGADNDGGLETGDVCPEYQGPSHPPLMKRNRQENEFINILIAQVLAPVTLFFFPMHVKVIGRMNKNSLGLQKMFVKHLELISFEPDPRCRDLSK